MSNKNHINHIATTKSNINDKSYVREVHPFKQRLNAIWHIIFDRNFILITGINEKITNGENSRRLKTIRRTDYGGDSDYISCLGGAEICKPKECNHDMYPDYDTGSVISKCRKCGYEE